MHIMPQQLAAASPTPLISIIPHSPLPRLAFVGQVLCVSVTS